jgi:NitT/TauT family transport system permease protein
VVVFGKYPEFLLPSPVRVAAAIIELLMDGRLFVHVLVSLKRFFIGYAVSCILAGALGVFFGWFQAAWRLAEPIVLLLKPISPIAWAPFIMLWFGLGNAPAIFTIALAGFFTMLLTTVKTINNVNSSYIRVAANFGLTRLQTLRKIVLPASFPYMAQGLHSALTASWIFLVAGELLGTESGLGFLINDSRQNLRTDLIMAGIVLIGGMGYSLDRLLLYFEKKVSAAWGVE